MVYRHRPIASLAVAATVLATLLAGCGGSPSTPAPGAPMGAGGVLPTNMNGVSTDALHSTPDATKLQVKPATMTFTTKAQQTAQLVPNTDFYTQTNTCVKKHILKAVKPFSYGIYYITPGKTDGSCTVTFTDTVTKSTATMKVVNKIQ